MAPQLPPEIATVPLTPSGVRYILPRRPRGIARLPGRLLVGSGVLLAGVSLALIVAATQAPATSTTTFSNAFPYVLIGLACIAVGLAVLWGRSEAEMRDGVFRAIERLGPIRFSRRRRLDRIRRWHATILPVVFMGKRVRLGPAHLCDRIPSPMAGRAGRGTGETGGDSMPGGRSARGSSG